MPFLNEELWQSPAPVAYTPFSLEHWAYTAFVKSSIKQACSANCFIRNHGDRPTCIKNCYDENNMILRETPLFETVRVLKKAGIYLQHYAFGIYWEADMKLDAEMDRFNIDYLELYWKGRYLASYEMFHCDSWGEYCNETYEWSESRFIDDFLLNIDNIRPWCYCSIKHAGFTWETTFRGFDRQCYLLEGHTNDCELK